MYYKPVFVVSTVLVNIQNNLFLSYCILLYNVVYYYYKKYSRKETNIMSEIVFTMKLHLKDTQDTADDFLDAALHYSAACDFISEYMFNNKFILNFMKLQKILYHDIRNKFNLKSQMAISALKTVIARYKTIQEQMKNHPFCYTDEKGKNQSIERILEWLQKPVKFRRPQIDLVFGRDYSFLFEGLLSINTLKKDRAKIAYDVPEYFEKYFDGSWKFGMSKLVSLKGQWYLHIPMTKEIPDTFNVAKPTHVVGIDRGLRFILTEYNETGKTTFVNGQSILKKREQFKHTRTELQAKGTKSAKRALKRISGRENRWMSDVNHQLSKTLVDKYGKGTLFVIEDLTGVSFSEKKSFIP